MSYELVEINGEHYKKLTEEKLQQFKENLRDTIKYKAEDRVRFELSDIQERAFEECINELAKEGFDTSQWDDYDEDKYLPECSLHVLYGDEFEEIKKEGATLEKFIEKE